MATDRIGCTIRRAKVDDAADIQDITHKAFEIYLEELHQDYQLTALTESLEDIEKDITERMVFVAEDYDGRVIGSIRIKALTSELAYIYRFGVLPEIKNIGVGSKLLAQACDYCECKGYKAITLHTNSRFYTLARYYYGKRFFVHSTSTEKGYIRALFVKELTEEHDYDISPAFNE